MTLAAFTALGVASPPYFNATRDGDEVVVIVRGPPIPVPHGIRVCSHSPGPGNCTAGGPTCNNYCNMAPEKGPMADRPLPNPYEREGVTSSMRIPVAEFARMLDEMKAGLA